MPIYKYKTTKEGCDKCKDGFEIMQSMSADPLEKCPDCGNEIQKVPALCNGYSPFLSNSNLRDKGFTKMVKRGDGTYEKVT